MADKEFAHVAWRDNEKLFDLYDSILSRGLKEFPYSCPVCNKESAHVYFYRFENTENKSGIWIWCSECKSYIHSSGQAPDWWSNCNEIKFSSLTSEPNYLEANKNLVDEWIRMI